jgi:molybdenum cofactor synthesis domain-containing protein
MRTAAVIIASTRAAAGIYPDRTGPLIAEWLTARGFDVTGPNVVADGPDVERALRDAVGVDLVITSGGTGISPTDRTPQATAAILDCEIPGLASAIRQQGSDAIPTAVLSRGLAGVAGRTLVVNLPGSTGGVSDGLVVLDRVLDHALDQISGGDHQSASHHQHSFGHQHASGAPQTPGHDRAEQQSTPGGEREQRHPQAKHQSLSGHQHGDGDPGHASTDLRGGAGQ